MADDEGEGVEAFPVAPGPWNADDGLATPALVVPRGAGSIGYVPLPAEAAAAADPPVARPEFAALSSRFEFLGEIARGGMGVVFRGRDLRMGREVAIKLLREAHADHPEMRRRFLEEAQIAGQLQHPGIVPIYETGRVAGGRPFIVMKLIRGRTLAAILADRTDPSQDPRHCLTLLLLACQAVAYAHTRCVIHRDLKPANIMVGRFGQVRVMDWGLAKVRPSRPDDLGAGESASPRWDDDDTRPEPSVKRPSPAAPTPRDGSRLGTPAYMAPEQASGDDARVDERSDVFGLGATLYEILSGRPPFQDDEPEQIFRKLQDAVPASLRANHRGIPRDLETVCLKCLERDPARRYADAGRLARDLERFLEGRPITARPVGALGRLDRWCRRNRVITLSLAVAGLSLLLLGVGGMRAAYLQAALRERAEAGAVRARMGEADANRQRDVMRRQFQDTVVDLEQLTSAFDRTDQKRPKSDGFLALKLQAMNLRMKNLEAYLERRDDPREPKSLRLWCMFNLGRLRSEFGPQDQSDLWYGRALTFGREIADDPGIGPDEAETNAGITLNSALGLAANLGVTRRFGPAIDLERSAIRDALRFRERYPKNHAIWEAHYALVGNLALALKRSGHADEAEALGRERELLLRAAP